MVAQVLGINKADVTVNVTLLGGRFGRETRRQNVIAYLRALKK